MPDTRPVLIFTWGNPSRGDDAIGPLIHDLLQHENPENVDLLTDFQLQIEHATDLENREYILFIDASASAKAPYDFYRLEPSQDDTYTTHAMSPSSLLAVYKKIYNKEPPPAFMLSIRGYAFDLGLPLSEKANHNLVSATEFIRTLLSNSAEAREDQSIATAYMSKITTR
jgi:hydrogenase maturation protease